MRLEERWVGSLERVEERGRQGRGCWGPRGAAGRRRWGGGASSKRSWGEEVVDLEVGRQEGGCAGEPVALPKVATAADQVGKEGILRRFAFHPDFPPGIPVSPGRRVDDENSGGRTRWRTGLKPRP